MKYILGGGISGLIFAYFNPEYTIITENVGGQMGSSFQLGPRFLHKTINSELLLNKLEIPYQERTASVGYLDDFGLVDSPDIEFRQKYFLKSRNTNSLEGFDSSVMNSNKNTFSVLDVDFSLLIKKLRQSIKSVKLGNIIALDSEARSIKIISSKEEIIAYDDIISTIPLNMFSLMLENKSDLIYSQYKSHSMTYCLVGKSNEFDICDFDFVYDAGKHSKYHRLTADKMGVVLDFFGELNEEELKLYTGNKYITHRTLLNSQIISNNKEPKLDNVKFIGRYGTWNRLWKTEKVIDEAIDWKKD